MSGDAEEIHCGDKLMLSAHTIQVVWFWSVNRCRCGVSLQPMNGDFTLGACLLLISNCYR